MYARETVLIRFAALLTRLRQERGLSLRQLAARAGLEYSLVQRIEKGKVNFAFSTLVALAGGLDLQPWELLRSYTTPS